MTQQPTPSDPRAIAIADRVVPAYRNGTRSYSCSGHVAKMWEAAYNGAFAVLDARMKRDEARTTPTDQRIAEQAARRAALIERLGTTADLACAQPLRGDLGDVAYDLLRQAAAQIASDAKRLATAPKPEPTPVESGEWVMVPRALPDAMKLVLIREWVGGERYARDYEYCDATFGPRADAAWAAALTAAPKAPNGAGEVLPQHIGRVHLGERRSDGERLCSHGHPVVAGQALYWPERMGEYPDDMDPLCLAHAIEQAVDDNGWCETCTTPSEGRAEVEREGRS